MTDGDRERFSHVIRVMEDTNRVRERELRKLSESPDYFRYAEMLADEFEGALTRLCNYASATAGRGEEVDIQEVIDDLQKHFRRGFERVTGRQYVPQVVRDFEGRYHEPE